MRFWGARYSRTWLTTLAGLPLLIGVGFSVLAGTRTWIALALLAVVVVGAIWLVPLAVVGDQGIRLLLRGRLVRWSEIETVLDPRPGDEDLRVEVTGGRVVRLDGIPPSAAADLRALRAAHR
jgi:hypothetical protein